ATIARPTMAPPLDVSMLLGASMMASRKGTGTPSPPSQSPRDSLSSGVMCQLLPHLVLSRALPLFQAGRETPATELVSVMWSPSFRGQTTCAFIPTTHAESVC